jgi:hypothetical protein
MNDDDYENIDPAQFSKRSKGSDNSFSKDIFKSSSFVLTTAASTPGIVNDASAVSPAKPSALLQPSAPRLRSYLRPKSPAAKLNTSIARPSPLSAPAGRSPTRASKRIGILSNRRRSGGSFARVDPPSFNLSAPAPFSLDAALKGTIPSYGRSPGGASGSLHESGMKSSWFFDIHEDTPEQEITNMLQHSTCTLDISSDEESEQRARRERAEGRDKENIPPADDVSQTSSSASRRAAPSPVDEMVVEKVRGPLAEMDAADYYPEGCDGSSVVIVPGDEDMGGEEEREVAPPTVDAAAAANAFEFAPEQKENLDAVSVDSLMAQSGEPAAKAAVLEPMEGTGENFELWESNSAKDEAEAPPSPSPILDAAGVAPIEC